jgi:hypothetical protein
MSKAEEELEFNASLVTAQYRLAFGLREIKRIQRAIDEEMRQINGLKRYAYAKGLEIWKS